MKRDSISWRHLASFSATDFALQGAIFYAKIHTNCRILRHKHHENAGIRSYVEAPSEKHLTLLFWNSLLIFDIL